MIIIRRSAVRNLQQLAGTSIVGAGIAIALMHLCLWLNGLPAATVLFAATGATLTFLTGRGILALVQRNHGKGESERSAGTRP